MNILLVSDGNVERSGVCMFLLQWSRGILDLKEGHRVIVYFRKTVKDPELAEEFRQSGIRIVTGDLQGTASSFRIRNRRKIRRDLKRIFHGFPCDIVHINSSALGFTEIVLKESKRAGIPGRITHCHGRVPGKGFKKLYLWKLRQRVMADATKLAACSEDAGQFFFGKESRAGKDFTVIPDMIEAEKFVFDQAKRKQLRESIGVGEEELLLGAVGTLSPVKNPFFLLKLLRDLIQNGKTGQKVRLIFLGEGELGDKLMQKAKEMGIAENVILYGAARDIAGWLSAMDIYLMPSLSEGFGIAAVEAQANGLYCLLSKGVPGEVCVTKKAVRLSLRQGTVPWEERIVWIVTQNRCSDERKNAVYQIKQAGFSQESIGGWIRKLYGWEREKDGVGKCDRTGV